MAILRYYELSSLIYAWNMATTSGVSKADSETSALDLLKLLKLQNEQTPLFLVD